jgi:D-glycero-D-manno-heptose 1,7-bisphosphate phosphatase
MRILPFSDKRTFYGPAVFLDRDGVINCRIPGGYVLEWSQFTFMPGICEALKALSTLQLPIVVISNQSAVGRGLLEPAVLDEITVKMYQTLLRDGISLTAVYYCIHKPADSCICRKPKPELLYRAAAEFSIDLKRSIFVGDSDTDVWAARSAGCQPLLFGSERCSSSDSPAELSGVPTARTAKELFQAAAELLRTRKEVFRPAGDSVYIKA